MGTNIVDNLAVHATCISDDFLDKYLGTANGDYIKVYLYMLRHKGERFSVGNAADSLNLTDNDIERAVRYWEKLGVFKSAAGVSVDKDEAEEKPADTNASFEAEFTKADEKIAHLEGTVDDVQDDEEFKGILFVAKHILPTLPSIRQIEVLKYMYKDLNMSADVIEYLLEYCASIKKTTYKYMQAVAINWHEQGVVSLSQARELVKSFEEKAAKKATPKVSKPVAKPNRFINFEQREVDYDSIVNTRVLNRMNNVTN
ncbi:DnaD domain-containing protein [Oribacterium sp. WCC10]|uniref:DnaD domain-containing protein n=1 Tax=Oribacterium sp. WCC10 TaxID=1855343 RepID=UPI0008F3F0E2|nr:DnaD domain protein [Oribacterium sp. WCC10]SFG35147.1 DnaD and phage-associated domain-containing protein [Oribacterium sp. WCC10]